MKFINFPKFWTSADAVTYWTRILEYAPYLKQAGFEGIRLSPAEPLYLVGPNTRCTAQQLDYIYQQVDIIAQCEFDGPIRLSFSDSPTINTAWKALNGGVAWADDRHPPFVSQPSMAEAWCHGKFEYFDLLRTRGTAAGISKSRWEWIWYNEFALGAVGNTIIPELKALLEGLGYEGYWDTTTHWSSTWAPDLIAEGYSAHTANEGRHDSCQVEIEFFEAGIDSDVRCWLPSYACEDIGNELLTHRPEGYDWFNSSVFLTNGRPNVTVNCYGLNSGIHPYMGHARAYAKAHVDWAMSNIDQIREAIGPCNLFLSEWNFLPVWMTGSYSRTQLETVKQGKVQIEASEMYSSRGIQNALYTLGSVTPSDDNDFCLIPNPSSGPSGAMIPWLQVGGWHDLFDGPGLEGAYELASGETSPSESGSGTISS